MLTPKFTQFFHLPGRIFLSIHIVSYVRRSELAFVTSRLTLRRSSNTSMVVVIASIFFSRLFRYLPYGFQDVQRLPYYVPFLFYLYFQQLVKLYAVLTLQNVGAFL